MELLTSDQVTQLPAPEWLIKGLFPTGGFVVLYGPSGHGKSFVALDWAYHIATDRNWQGLSVNTGPVIYVAAEGRGGLSQRIEAWQNKYRTLGAPVYFSLEPLDILGNGPEELLSVCSPFAFDPDEPPDELFPRLIVIDTLARCFLGDENEAEAMARFVSGIDDLRLGLGATVLIIHHEGKDRGRGERGSSALRGAADTMIRMVKKQDETMLLTCTKQKDAIEFDEITLRLESVGSVDKNSCIIAPGCTVDQALTLVLADTALGSTLARARQMANLTGLSVETCRNRLRGLGLAG